MNTDNKTPEEAMDKPVAASAPNAGESPQTPPDNTQDTKPPSPAAQQSSADAATATANEQAAEKRDGIDAAKPQAQSASDDNKESAVQNADAEVAKETKEKAEDTKAAKRSGGGPRRVSGVVVGDKADKTARVRIERRVKHALYGKVIRRRTHLQAHDADNKCRIGDMVTLEESPRFSKTKSWRVVAITPGEGR